jgi:hypothetical protein
MTTLTSANSVFLLTVAGIFTTPQRLQGFSTDSAFGTDAIDLAEVMMGVDGRMSAGYTPQPFKTTVTLQADSPSNIIMDTWAQATRTAREVFPGNGTIVLPSLNKKFAMTRGFLTSYPPMAEAKKVLQPRAYVITWEDISPAAN